MSKMTSEWRNRNIGSSPVLLSMYMDIQGEVRRPVKLPSLISFAAKNSDPPTHF